MSLNPNTRTTPIEMLANRSEVDLLDTLRGHEKRGPFLRRLLHSAASTHGMPPQHHKEPRSCRGVGKPASRGHGFMSQRRLV